MGGFKDTRMTFSILTIITILCVVCLHRYLKWKMKNENEESPIIMIKNHSMNVRFRSRDYIVLLLIFVIEWVFLMSDLNGLMLTSGTIWSATLIELQLLLVWYLQEQRQISEVNMILRILSLSFTLFFGWIFLLFLLFHDIDEMRISLFIIFITNCVLSLISIIHNVLCKDRIKYIKIQSPAKPWLVNIILILLCIISLFEILTGIPLHENESRTQFKAFIASYRILTFLCTLFICFMITFRRQKENQTSLTVGGSYKTGDRGKDFLHGRASTLRAQHNKYGTQIKLASVDTEEEEEQKEEKEEKEDKMDKGNLMQIPEHLDTFETTETKERKDNQVAMETMYEYGRREGNKSWQSVEATFIGGESVGKTLLIRSLWKLDISNVDPKYKKKSAHQRKASSHQKRLSYLDNAELLEYDRYNMIDLYRRWDPILRVKFKFWDTVGDVRFLNSILQCMLSSEVIVAMYTLENDRYKEEKKLMNVHDTVKFLLAIELGIRQLVSNTHREEEKGVDLCFAVLLIGISKMGINKTLRHKNEEIFSSLRKKCKHLNLITYPTADGDPSQIFHINYKESHPSMSCLVQILWSIYQVKKSALQNGFIKDSRICCGLLKVPNAPIYDITSTLAQNIKHQPFVLRKIEQGHFSHKFGQKETIVKRRRSSASISMSIGMYARSLQKKEKRQVVGGPIASVHHWKLTRPIGTILYRTIGCLISGIFFPFLVVMQTTMFWCYCAEWGISNEGLSRIVSNYRISQYGTFLLDFLYPIFPRSQPDPAVETAINTGLRSLLNQKSSSQNNKGGIYKIDWFFRQTNAQKVLRTIIAFSIVLLFTFLTYNFSYWVNIEDEIENQISIAESVGGLMWFVIIWFMMGTWYGHRVEVNPDVDTMFADEDRTSFRLHYKDTSFGNDMIHTNVEVFLRSYTFYHASKKKSFQWFKPAFFLFIGAVYSLIPGVYRVYQDKPFVVKEHPYVVTRAIISNFVLVSLANYVFDKAFYSYFQQYARLIFDVTTIIEIPGDDNAEEEDEEDNDNDKTFKRPSYHGSGFEFLSLDDPENLISWLEIRSYAYVKGRQLFAELELFILFFCIIMIFQAGFVVLTLFEYAGAPASETISATFLCVVFMLLINFGWMIKVFILGTKFDQLQRRQQYALVNQMTCIRAEALTTAVFTGPIGWIELNVGAWDKLFNLLHERRKQRDRREKEKKNKPMDNKILGAILNFELESDIDFDDDEKEEEEDNDVKIAEETVDGVKKKKKKDVYKRKFKYLKQKIQRYFYDTHQEEEKWKELRSLQEDFDHYLDLLMLAYYKVQQNSIHPKIFGLGLSGALMKTMAAATLTTVFAVVRFVFFA